MWRLRHNLKERLLQNLVTLTAFAFLWTGSGLLGLVMENIAKYRTLRTPKVVKTSEPERFNDHLKLGPISFIYCGVQLLVSFLRN